MKHESYTQQEWRDAFIAEGIELEINADVVDSVLRQLEKEESWAMLKITNPVSMAQSEFYFQTIDGVGEIV